MHHFGDNFIPIILTDSLQHTPDTPFCWDDTCFCHKDQDAVNAVNEAYQEGLLSADDATRIVQGRTV